MLVSLLLFWLVLSVTQEKDTRVLGLEQKVAELEEQVEQLKSGKVVKKETKKEPTKNEEPKEEQPQTKPRDVVGLLRYYTIEAFGEAHWAEMYQLIRHESGFRPDAVNPTSGACGLGQFLPCNKYGTGPIVHKPVEEQIQYVIRYVSNRYGNPTNAWSHWTSNGWY